MQDERQQPVLAVLLPEFWQTDLDTLPAPTLIYPEDILQHLKQDPAKHGVVIANKIAIWNSDPSEGSYWYVLRLPLDEPEDTYMTVEKALHEALLLAI